MKTGLQLLLVGLMLLGTACDRPPATILLSGSVFGTGWSVQLYELPAGATAESLTGQILAALEEVDRTMSTWRADAEIVLFNEAAPDAWFEVSPAVVDVVDEAVAVSRMSDGAFDITVAPLVSLWGFGATAAQRRKPELAALTAARSLVGFDKIATRRQPPALRKSQAGVTIDLSAIAKGYAVDEIAELLASLGVQDYLVEIGGELRAAGRNVRGQIWRVAVERPDAAGREATEVIALDNRAIATSGDYRNVYERDGRLYSHTIDPRTGAPVTHRLASVTVLTASAMRADALATALLVLGPDAGARLATRSDLAVLFIERRETGFVFWQSPAMEAYRGGLDRAATR